MTLVWVCGKIHFINIKTYSSHQTYSSSLIKLHAAHLIVNSSWVVRSHHSWYDRDVSQAEGIYSELWKDGVILSAVRRWGGGQPDRLSGRWKLWFWGDLVEANQQHPKYTTRALRLCVVFGFPGTNWSTGQWLAKEIICHSIQAFHGLGRLRQPCCSLLKIKGLFRH